VNQQTASRADHPTMPKATSQKLSRQQAPALSSASSRPAKKGAAAGEEGASGGGGKNHLFDTAKFGQHILMNPLVAQG
jgi:18S rRNA (adenine1779-N6/adenine1780-N6)-dimethyltransferase